MSDLIQLSEVLAAADDEAADCPPLPPPHQRRAVRLAADTPLVHVAAAVGVSGPTIYRAEMGTGVMKSAAAARRYRRVLGLLQRLVLQRDPHGLVKEAI